MARKPKFSVEALSKLGAERLAATLYELAQNDRRIKQALTLQLSAEAGADTVASDIRNRLNALARSRSFVDWRRVRQFTGELNQLRTAIVELLGPKEPALAVDLLWRFLDLHGPIIERVDDSNGNVGDVFRVACVDAAALAERTGVAPGNLAATIFSKITNNPHGIYDDLVTDFKSSLVGDGFTELKKLLLQWKDKYLTEDARRKIAEGRYDSTLGSIHVCLREIADCENDVDGFLETYDARALANPKFVAELAQRLIAAGRATEALAYLDDAAPSDANRYFARDAWTDQRIAALDAIERKDEAQALRLSVFRARLDAVHLRAYLKALPDFDDLEAENAALDYAVQHPSFHAALHFLVHWPALDHAARLVMSRPGELDGDHFFLLSPAAEALEGKFPLAAVLIRRAMIDYSLDNRRSTRYGHAARHVLEIEGLDAGPIAYGDFETHGVFMARLKLKHGRKSSFWARLATG